MIKHLIVVGTLFVSSFAFAGPHDNGCPIHKDEKLVCAVVMCNPIGMAIPESFNECLKVNRDFAIYLATLGFWDKPPKCHARDENCNKTGRASTAQMSPEHCVAAGDDDKKAACMTALGAAPEGYCNQFNERERVACESVQQTGQLNEEYCEQLAEERRWNGWRFLERWIQERNEERYEQCVALYDLQEGNQ